MKNQDKSITKEKEANKKAIQKQLDEAVMRAIDKSMSKHKIFQKVK